jgi:predicted permease
MTLLRRLSSILDWIVRRDRSEARLDDEMQSFVEMSAAEKVRDGYSAEEARRLARMELGGVEQVKENVRGARHGHLIDESAKDIRYALRMFARAPGFTAVILLTLALGIGANTAIFSLIDALMLRTLPVARPGELVQLNLQERTDLTGFGGDSFSYAIVKALDARRVIFAGAAGFSSLNVNVGTPGSLTRVHGALVTGNYFGTLGLVPAAGRLLTREDDQVGAALAAVISDAYWARAYGRAASAVGQVILGNGLPITIVGVAPRGFTGTDPASVADITMTVATLPRLYPNSAALLGPGTFFLRVLARPVRGLTRAAAESRLNAVWPRLSDEVIAQHWEPKRRQSMAESVWHFAPGATGWSGLRQTYRQPLFVLMTVAGLVLLIACSNVASLFLARATARRREIAVRLAIGAGRARIVRQLVTEGVLLSFAGAALGIGVAALSGRFLVDLISSGPFTVEFDLTPNWHVLAFSAVIATVTGVVFGLAPAFQTRRGTAADAALGSVLTDNSRTSTTKSRLLPSLVVGQIALSLVLVAGAGLFVRTLRNLQHVDPGFASDRVFIAPAYTHDLALRQQFVDAVSRVPGIVSLGFSTHTPLDGSAWSEAVSPVGAPIPEKDNARVVAAGPQFFDALRIGIPRGRNFSDRDVKGAPLVALVNERYAEREFPDQDPIGRHLVAKLMGKPVDMEIVGITANVQFGGLRIVAPATVYVPFAQFEGDLLPNLVIRAEDGSGDMRARIAAAMQPLIPSGPVQIVSLPAQVNATIVQERMMATLAAGFGVLALVLCAVGLYGLLAYGVAQRSREIGIRMALGARPVSVVSGVLISGARLVAIGLAIGYPAAWAGSRSIEAMLYGLKPTDPTAMIGAAVLLAAAALVACYLPARRASRVDPLIALRHD